VTHNVKQGYDQGRENRLRELGFNILRLDGYYVINNISGALESIMACIEEIENKTSP
jgi:very-short-patch-repair endonuclease